MLLMKNTKYSAGVTDALQQRSRYQCALKMKKPDRCRSEVGSSFSASYALKPVSWPSTALITDTRAGSTRVGLRVTEDELRSMY